MINSTAEGPDTAFADPCTEQTPWFIRGRNTLLRACLQRVLDNEPVLRFQERPVGYHSNVDARNLMHKILGHWPCWMAGPNRSFTERYASERVCPALPS